VPILRPDLDGRSADATLTAADTAW